MKWGDVVVILIVAGIALFSWLSTHNKSDYLYLSVKTAYSQKNYRLNQYKKITNHGPIGNSILVISNGTVYMQSSPCPLQICVHEGKISRDHQSIICFPNKIEAVILSSNISGVDAVSR